MLGNVPLVIVICAPIWVGCIYVIIGCIMAMEVNGKAYDRKVDTIFGRSQENYDDIPWPSFNAWRFGWPYMLSKAAIGRLWRLCRWIAGKG